MWIYLAALVGLYFLRRWYQERQSVDNLTEKYVFITGCDSGFGNQLAKQLDARGLRVIAACFTEKGAEQLEKATSERLRTTILDITSPDSVAKATQWVKEQVGSKGLWGLVNNAGVVIPIAPNEWLTKNDFIKVLDINLLGTIDVTLHMISLVRRAQGRVVNVSSAAGRIAVSGGGYSISKFALEAFSDSLRRELHPFGVGVSIIEPGSFDTGMSRDIPKSLPRLWEEMPAEIRELYGENYWNSFLKALHRRPLPNSKLYLVTDCMEHALTSRYPRSRYSAGWDAKLVFIPLSYLPSWIADYLLSVGFPRPAGAVQ
ncbi:17-beta-hydroxysteroid dehydrogenase type 6-like isoform X1 [Hemicordylus capensis]|uniref:17-beta-hydroxysteroid dehydrogenase type 6-like isoform X1 n=1 Tax=Hemicordylus capensis TaxID=884348 RepID=UPI0023035421|nr:17-beta-hydroxysteroid dehydrogenase type 6-like isoform X1 [Hemicordylus capensis]